MLGICYHEFHTVLDSRPAAGASGQFRLPRTQRKPGYLASMPARQINAGSAVPATNVEYPRSLTDAAERNAVFQKLNLCLL